MAYLVNYKGVIITLESLDEVAKLTRTLTAEEKSPQRPRGQKRDQNTEQTAGEAHPNDGGETTLNTKMAAFWKDIASAERLVLVALANQASAIGTDELAAAAKVDAMELKYCVKRISSRAKKHTIDPKLLIDRKTVAKSRPVKSIYSMKEKARQAILPLIVGVV